MSVFYRNVERSPSGTMSNFLGKMIKAQDAEFPDRRADARWETGYESFKSVPTIFDFIDHLACRTGGLLSSAANADRQTRYNFIT
jgi:hypothetical protein